MIAKPVSYLHQEEYDWGTQLIEAEWRIYASVN